MYGCHEASDRGQKAFTPLGHTSETRVWLQLLFFGGVQGAGGWGLGAGGRVLDAECRGQGAGGMGLSF